MQAAARGRALDCELSGVAVAEQARPKEYAEFDRDVLRELTRQNWEDAKKNLRLFW